MKIYECNKCGEVWGGSGPDAEKHDCEAEETEEDK